MGDSIKVKMDHNLQNELCHTILMRSSHPTQTQLELLNYRIPSLLI